MKTSLRIIGVGNELRGDDGVGLRVARALAALDPAGAEVLTSNGDPADLEEKWRGAERVVVIDASVGGNEGPGTVRRYPAHEGPISADLGSSSSHSFGLAQAIELSRVMGTLSRELVLITIEAADVTYGTELTPPVATAAERVVEELTALLEDHHRP
jgi:hydrogenase maturation protease